MVTVVTVMNVMNIITGGLRVGKGPTCQYG